MRFTYRMKLGNITAMFLLSHTQSLKGITSKVGEDQHVILLDLETKPEKSYAEVREELIRTQNDWNLPHIFVTSDKPCSYHGYCYGVVPLRIYLRIMLSIPSVDDQFIKYTVKRDEATLRINRKHDRPPQKIYDVLPSFPVRIPPQFPVKLVRYDTGLEKRGRYINLERNKSTVIL